MIAIQKFLSRVARKLSSISADLSRTFYQTPDEVRKAAWFSAGVEMTLRLDYDLDADSVVFDVGGYEGQWASDIFSKYGCTVHVFEPVKPFAEKIAQRFERNPKIHCHAIGLAGETKKLTIFVEAYASSVFKGGKQREEIALVDAVSFIEEHDLRRIDLLKVNIEGGEYELLDRLIDTGCIGRIVDLQVQFHDFVPEAEVRMQRLQEKLRATHHPTYQYPFIWENWHLNTPVTAKTESLVPVATAV